MQIDLDGQIIAFAGDHNAVADAAFSALLANGGREGPDADLLLVSMPLVADEAVDVSALLDAVRDEAARMADGEGGRCIFIVSAAAGMPMRRYPRFSAQMATVMAAVRGLAMSHGPKVLVNAVGVGAVGEPVVAGDAAMLSHASIKRPAAIDEIVDTVLFFADPLNSYTTGQMLAVDGGWMAGYGRNF